MSELFMSNFINVEESYNDPFSNINKLFIKIALRDRFGILNKHSPIKFSNEIDAVGMEALSSGSEPETISNLMDAEAVKYIGMNKPIYLSFSGGVDSTSVLIALLRNQVKKDQLYIICAPTTKDEYPWLYNMLLDQKYNLICTDKVENYYNASKGVILTGWCADQLFGSNIHLKDLSLYNKPWFEALKLYCKGQNIFINNYDEIYDVYTDYANKLGLNIEQWCEFAWMINFGCKWSYVTNITKLFIPNQEPRDNTYAFFNTFGFQHWVVNNYKYFRDVNPETNPAKYKRPLKEYIYEYTKDSVYLNKKSKTTSVALSIAPKFISTIDTEGYHFYDKRYTNLIKKQYLK